jgi:hypothetical protein
MIASTSICVFAVMVNSKVEMESSGRLLFSFLILYDSSPIIIHPNIRFVKAAEQTSYRGLAEGWITGLEWYRMLYTGMQWDKVGLC